MEAGEGKETLSTQDTRTLNSIFNPNLPHTEDEEVPELVDDEDTSPEGCQAKELEIQGVKAAEQGDILGAIDFFNQAVNVAPRRASSYNNRAQALRLKGDVEGAKQDLEKAIELSGGKGKTASQAYTQRGVIHRFEGEDDAALDDFKQAARLGSPFAKEMYVALNPYAALCNQMLGEMIHKCQTGEM